MNFTEFYGQTGPRVISKLVERTISECRLSMLVRAESRVTLNSKQLLHTCMHTLINIQSINSFVLHIFEFIKNYNSLPSSSLQKSTHLCSKRKYVLVRFLCDSRCAKRSYPLLSGHHKSYSGSILKCIHILNLQMEGGGNIEPHNGSSWPRQPRKEFIWLRWSTVAYPNLHFVYFSTKQILSIYDRMVEGQQILENPVFSITR